MPPIPSFLGTSVPTVVVAGVRSAFLRVNVWTATGPNGVPGLVFRMDQLAEVYRHL